MGHLGPAVVKMGLAARLWHSFHGNPNFNDQIRGGGLPGTWDFYSRTPSMWMRRGRKRKYKLATTTKRVYLTSVREADCTGCDYAHA